MNKNRHRKVFNRSCGCIKVVSESANNVSITATGAGSDSRLTVQGSEVKAANSVTLAADNQVNLQAAQNTASQASTNSSSSGSLGVSYGAASGWGFSASASKGQGRGNGGDVSFTNTQVQAGNTATLQSGGDTNVKGAVVAANSVVANVGTNLNIESLQDTSTYASKQSSAGGSISFGAGGITGGGVSANQSKIDSNFASVGQQSGIKAGDGGFQVAVNNNTDLKGAVIASTQAAVDTGKNSFTSGGTLTHAPALRAAASIEFAGIWCGSLRCRTQFKSRLAATQASSQKPQRLICQHILHRRVRQKLVQGFCRQDAG